MEYLASGLSCTIVHKNQNLILKSRIRETKNLLTNADSSTNTKKNLASKAKFTKKNKKNSARRFYTLYDQKFSNLKPHFSITFPQKF